MGLPCVLTDVGGVKEMVVDGVNGYLVPPRDLGAIARCWARVLNDAQGFNKGAIRKTVSERFSLERMIRGLESLMSADAARGQIH